MMFIPHSFIKFKGLTGRICDLILFRCFISFCVTAETSD